MKHREDRIPLAGKANRKKGVTYPIDIIPIDGGPILAHLYFTDSDPPPTSPSHGVPENAPCTAALLFMSLTGLYGAARFKVIPAV